MADISKISPDGGTTEYNIKDADARLNKADKVSQATAGNLAKLDSNGNLVDSGKSADIIPSTATTSNKLSTASDISAIWSANARTGVHQLILPNYKVIGEGGAVTGIYWTNEKGVVTANGTTASGKNSQFGSTFIAPFTAQVILSGCSSTTSKVHIYPWDLTDNSRPYADSTKTTKQSDNVYNNSVTQFYMEEGHEYQITCRIQGATTQTTVDNFVFYPLLRLADDPDNTFGYYAMTNLELTNNKADNTVIGTVENGATASQAYAVGEHFIKDGKFCTCISAISSGGTFTKNTNYVEGTIADLKGMNFIRNLTNADNLNSIRTVGFYAILASPTNAPDNVTFCTLEVFPKSLNFGQLVIQRITTVGGSCLSMMMATRWSRIRLK